MRAAAEARLSAAGVEHALFERRSARWAARARPRRCCEAGRIGGAGGGRRARAPGGRGPRAQHAAAVRARAALAAARAAGARVVLHLHNLRLFCAIGVASRDGGPCFRCRGRRTLPGLVLNCRGSLPESAAYAAGLALHQPLVLDSRGPLRGAGALGRGQLAR